MLEQARALLEAEYKKCLAQVGKNDFYTIYADEKWVHSHQVLGAGNFIIKHEPWFQKQDKYVIDAAKNALLLHDVARFEEITQKFLNNIKIDHGVVGYEKLKQMPEYDEWLVAFAIKHHGHLKERFYEDEDYLLLKDESLRDKVEHIFWLVRDADKIANFNLMCNQTYLQLFLPKRESLINQENIITEEVIKDFYQCRTVDHALRQTVADYMMAFISWYFDLNYKSSVVFCKNLKLVDEMFKMLAKYHNDDELNTKLQSFLEAYLNKEFV